MHTLINICIYIYIYKHVYLNISGPRILTNRPFPQTIREPVESDKSEQRRKPDGQSTNKQQKAAWPPPVLSVPQPSPVSASRASSAPTSTKSTYCDDPERIRSRRACNAGPNTLVSFSVYKFEGQRVGLAMPFLHSARMAGFDGKIILAIHVRMIPKGGSLMTL